ncbi:hypothetical protein QCA50_004649 [Cerrena zonata]|uniref:Dyp-type peroxidase n=1 Tax=Cerrena zonata TaxID=2478898 RepID=A0AAW0GER0_9APHY
MTDIHSSLQNACHARACIPLIRDPKLVHTLRMAVEEEPLPDPANVQGDIYLLFPKVAECFLFFWISDADKFKAALKDYKPTSAADVISNLQTISAAKAKGQLADIIQNQVAFSRAGLNQLGQTEDLGDVRFDGGSMRRDKEALGDQREWSDIFDPGTVHGVFILAASDAQSRDTARAKLEAQFQPGVGRFAFLNGDRRPGEFKGHEHFGYLDGISQPAIRGLVVPRPGQIQVDPGVIIMGYKGDPVFDNQDPNAPKRPAWTKDGAFMVFRKLEQDVGGFEDYLTRNRQRWKDFWPTGTVQPPLTDDEGAELWGARMIGRFRSGCPVDLSPYRDNKAIAADPDENNNFDYVVPFQTRPSDIRCPFTAHTRKTAPRNLDPFFAKEFLESTAIVRAGLPYGKEYTEAPTDPDRGLLFVCYNSSITNGFYLQTTAFANNNYFPVTDVAPNHQGQDPILGGPGPIADANITNFQNPLPLKGEVTIHLQGLVAEPIEVNGFAKPYVPSIYSQDFFVTSRGGEYLFVPSIEMVKQLAT